MRAGWEIKVYNSKNGQSTTFSFRIEDEFIQAWRKLQRKKKQFPYLELNSHHYYEYDDLEIDPSCSDEFKSLWNKKDPKKTGRVGWCIAIWDNKRDVSKYLTFWEEIAYQEAWNNLQKKFAPYTNFKLTWNRCTEYEDNDDEIEQIIEEIEQCAAKVSEKIIEESPEVEESPADVVTSKVIETQLSSNITNELPIIKFRKSCKCGCNKPAVSFRGNDKFASYECRINFDSKSRNNKKTKLV
jgi:hypothetical protein